MDLRSDPKQNPRIFNKDYVTNENFEDNFEDPYELKHPSIITKYPTEYVFDYNINLRKKRYSKPYFSSDLHGREIDFMIVPFNCTPPKSIFKHFKTNQINVDEGNSNFYYLFAININTKYLYVFPSFKKDTVTVFESINKIINDGIKIKSIHGNYDRAFVSPTLINYLTNHNIRYYFTPNVYTNRNRVVDQVIHTIPDMFYNLGPTVSLFDANLMRKIVYKYNNTVHKSLFNRFTPNQAQHNSMIEHVFIMEKTLELEKVK
jgi:hypothetical protein